MSSSFKYREEFRFTFNIDAISMDFSEFSVTVSLPRYKIFLAYVCFYKYKGFHGVRELILRLYKRKVKTWI